MITGAFQHIRGVGPVRLQQLQQAGIYTWQDAVAAVDQIPAVLRDVVRMQAERCIEAAATEDIGFFVDTLHPHDRWRILHEYVNRCTWFDIETTGLEYDDTITVIACWHRGQLHTFVEHENLDDFLDLLDDVELLVSFNGSTFDVPRVLDGFHIPDLPCPHLDLRWICHYRNLVGGLKQITARLGMQRPDDLQDADGSLAIRLWSRWISTQDSAARDQLLRYCAADVLLLVPLTQYVAGHPHGLPADFWQHLPEANVAAEPVCDRERRRRELAASFGSASPMRLRTRRRA